MKNKTFILSWFLIFCCIYTKAQQLEVSYNPLLILNYSDNTQGQTHRQIGNYRVKGSSYLFNSTFKVTVFYKGASFSGDRATYDTYFQKVENMDTNNKMSEFDITTVDSFKVDYMDNEKGQIKKTFIRSSLVDSSKNIFLEKLAGSPGISFYKAYTSVLGDYVDGFVQTTGYKQFKPVIDYYYITPSAVKLIKTKLSEKDLKKVLGPFGNTGFLSENAFYDDPESSLIYFVNSLNAKG
jgi:hypothetical protein